MKTYYTRICEAIELKKDDLHVKVSEYSGRGMYGRMCVSINGSKMDCMDVLIEAIIQAKSDNMHESDFEDFVTELIRHETDSLGHGVVFYFPAIQKEE